MRVVVTGGAGFIGSHVVDRLRAAGHEPVVFDLRPSPWHDDVATVTGDLLDPRALDRALAGCDAVAHLAAAADVGEVAEAPVAAEELNARGTIAVLEAARRAGVRRVLYASTIWVYDGCGPGAEVDEDSLLGAPSHLYTATKLAGEHYCKAYGELYGLEWTVLRFGIPYGPRARPAAVVPAFVGRALDGQPLTVAGTGEQSRRFVYVEDLAEGVVRGLGPAAAGRVYNLVGDEDVTIRQIAETVRATVGDVEIEQVPGRAGDFAGARVCGRRAAEELGWTAQTPFSEGLRRYVEWAREERVAPPARRTAGVAGPVTIALWVLAGLLVVGGDLLFAHGESRAFVTGAVLATVVTVLGGLPGLGRQLSLGGVGVATLALAILAFDPAARDALGGLDGDGAALAALGVGAGALIGMAGRRALRPADAPA